MKVPRGDQTFDQLDPSTNSDEHLSENSQQHMSDDSTTPTKTSLQIARDAVNAIVDNLKQEIHKSKTEIALDAIQSAADTAKLVVEGVSNTSVALSQALYQQTVGRTKEQINSTLGYIAGVSDKTAGTIQYLMKEEPGKKQAGLKKGQIKQAGQEKWVRKQRPESQQTKISPDKLGKAEEIPGGVGKTEVMEHQSGQILEPEIMIMEESKISIPEPSQIERGGKEEKLEESSIMKKTGENDTENKEKLKKKKKSPSKMRRDRERRLKYEDQRKEQRKLRQQQQIGQQLGQTLEQQLVQQLEQQLESQLEQQLEGQLEQQFEEQLEQQFVEQQHENQLEQQFEHQLEQQIEEKLEQRRGVVENLRKTAEVIDEGVQLIDTIIGEMKHEGKDIRDILESTITEQQVLLQTAQGAAEERKQGKDAKKKSQEETEKLNEARFVAWAEKRRKESEMKPHQRQMTEPESEMKTEKKEKKKEVKSEQPAVKETAEKSRGKAFPKERKSEQKKKGAQKRAENTEETINPEVEICVLLPVEASMIKEPLMGALPSATLPEKQLGVEEILQLAGQLPAVPSALKVSRNAGPPAQK